MSGVAQPATSSCAKAAPTLERYCEMRHLVVSMTGDAQGFVDRGLADAGRARRVALTVPNFMLALAMAADSDLIAAVPRRFATLYGPRFGVVAVEPPLALTRFRLSAVAPAAALMDDGVAWLLDLLAGVSDRG